MSTTLEAPFFGFLGCLQDLAGLAFGATAGFVGGCATIGAGGAGRGDLRPGDGDRRELEVGALIRGVAAEVLERDVLDARDVLAGAGGLNLGGGGRWGRDRESGHGRGDPTQDSVHVNPTGPSRQTCADHERRVGPALHRRRPANPVGVRCCDPEGMPDPLAIALGSVPPPELAEHLSAAEREALAAVITDARARQSNALQTALDGSLRHIPRLLRGPVMKLVRG